MSNNNSRSLSFRPAFLPEEHRQNFMQRSKQHSIFSSYSGVQDGNGIPANANLFGPVGAKDNSNLN